MGRRRIPRKVSALKFEGKRTQSLWKTLRRKEQAGRREKRWEILQDTLKIFSIF